MILQEKVKADYDLFVEKAEHDAFYDKRKKAFAEFERLGFPTTKNEEWKYTSLKDLTKCVFENKSIESIRLKELLSLHVFKDIASSQLVFVNGYYRSELSVILEKDPAIIITNLTHAAKQHKTIFDKHFGKYANIDGQAMNALNTALLNDGAFIYIEPGKKLEHPLLILNLVDSNEFNVLVQPRNLIIIDKNASATIVESYFSTGTLSSFTNAVSEIYVAENAQLEHYKVQRQSGESYHNNYTQIFQEANTRINQVTLTLDGKLVRNNLHFFMNGENGNSLLYGLYITEKENLVDNHTRVDHAKPNCFSDEKYKGILKDKSTAVFNGKIMVHRDAQKTNAYQRNQNILLSNEASVNTKPQLEIFADDVKCTHGATIGQLDEEPMFYLRSRGIPENEARRLLLNAFADDIAEKIKIPELVELLEREIEQKL